MYDTRKGRLLPDPIVDRVRPPETMRGYPVTRAFSADGQWAYTLYDGVGGHPFVHALNTREFTAACIDLHGLAGHRELMSMRLDVRPGDGDIAVIDSQQRPLYVIDDKTFRVRKAAPGAAGSETGGGFPTAAWLAGVVVVAIGGTLLMMRRRRTIAPSWTGGR